MDSHDRLRQWAHTRHALAVAVEPLTLDRRVAVFGDSSCGFAGLLVERGARAVTAWDPDRLRAMSEGERAPRGVTVRAYPPDDPGARGPDPRAVDLAVVLDLGAMGAPTDLLARVRGMVGEHGVAVIAAVNEANEANEEGEAGGAGEAPGAFDYYDLFDRVAREFDSVRMIAQLPFYGVALMELGGQDDSPAVSVDTRLAGSARTPEAFVVVASRERDLLIEAYSLVELPEPGPLAPAAIEATADEAPALHVALVEARLRGDVLASQLAEAQARASEIDRALADRTRQLAELASERERLRDVERRAALLEREVAQAASAQGAEFVRLEEGLRERARLARTLEAEVARRDGIVRDLVSALDDAGREPAPEDAFLRERLDTLALDLARREGEAKAGAWRVEELERRLAQASSVPAAASAAPPALAAALDELDALRKALVKEHDARRAAEALAPVVTPRVTEDDDRGA
ncbi:MAG: hypothetical protein ACREJ3_01980 [Polyangiaceae bacterium]